MLQLNDLEQQGKQLLTNSVNILKNSSYYLLITLSIVFILIFFVMAWIFDKLSLSEKICNKLDIFYSKQTGESFMRTETNVKSEVYDKFNNEQSSILKNYYIKTAYNCCNGDSYKNNFVNKCALEKCIMAGIRCLDFEVYSYNSEPIIASSTANNNSIKETYNYLHFDEICDILNIQSFDETYTSCANDPMFLHFRIMSENKEIFNKMAKYIKENLDRNPNNNSNTYLVNDYNYINNPNDILTISLKKLSKKFIIMVYTNPNNNTILNDTKLSKYVNIKSGTNTLKLYRDNDIISYGNNNEIIIDESKTGLIMVLPNINNKINNYNFIVAQSNGCQFIGMKFQNVDSNLVSYNKIFKDEGNYSFILKPNSLRKDLQNPYDRPESDNPLDQSATDSTHIDNTFGSVANPSS